MPTNDRISTDYTPADFTIWQRDGNQMVSLTPDDALGLLHTLWTAVQQFDYPEMILGEKTPEGETDAHVTMTCPRCGHETVAGDDPVTVVDMAVRFTDGTLDGDHEHPELNVYYGQSDFEPLNVQCASCGDPVRVPRNVTEVI